MPIAQSRRRLLTDLAVMGVAGLAGAGVIGLTAGGESLAAEPPPEVTTIRLARNPFVCTAPQLIADELLSLEGFTEIRRIEDADLDAAEEYTHVDWALNFAPDLVMGIDSGAPIMIVAGLHGGCYQLFARGDIRGIGDLKGKAVGINGASKQIVTIMARLVGLDPDKDIRWVVDPEPVKLFIAGKVDAYLAIPPEAQELRTRNVGRVIVDSSVDHPWSQYFCCMLAGNAEFVRKYPVASKRVLRAILKATDLCASEPKRVAQLLVDRGYTPRYDYALQAFGEVRYDVWRDYDPEDTLRFYTLRLNEAGVTKSVPRKLIAEHTDWRFLNELKRELKV